MVGKLASNSSHLTRGLVKYIPGRGYFRAVPSQNGDKYITSPSPPIVELVPCVFRLIRDGVVVMIMFMWMTLLLQESLRCDFLSTCLLEEFQITGGELSWYLGCAFERDRKGGLLRASQIAFIKSVVSRYGVDAVSGLPTSQSADLDPRRNDEPACDKPVRSAVGSLIWLGGMTRPDSQCG